MAVPRRNRCQASGASKSTCFTYCPVLPRVRTSRTCRPHLQRGQYDRSVERGCTWSALAFSGGGGGTCDGEAFTEQHTVFPAEFSATRLCCVYCRRAHVAMASREVSMQSAVHGVDCLKRTGHGVSGKRPAQHSDVGGTGLSPQAHGLHDSSASDACGRGSPSRGVAIPLCVAPVAAENTIAQSGAPPVHH